MSNLETTVVLPKPACTYADHSYPAYTEKQVKELLASLGYLVIKHNEVAEV